MTYPADYGFIPDTLGEDGDPLGSVLAPDLTPHPVRWGGSAGAFVEVAYSLGRFLIERACLKGTRPRRENATIEVRRRSVMARPNQAR